jgi:hypothetical protein
MEKQTVEIEAIVDKFMTVKLNLPKQIDAGSLLSLIQRLQKILKISPLPISLKKNGKRNGLDFTKDRKKAVEVLSKWYKDREGRQALAQSYGRDIKEFEPVIYYVKKKLKITNKEIK